MNEEIEQEKEQEEQPQEEKPADPPGGQASLFGELTTTANEYTKGEV